MQHQINPTPITQFAQLLRAAELSQQRELKIPIQQARLLNTTLTEMLDKLSQDYESLFNLLRTSAETESVSVEVDGGGFNKQ